METVIQKGKFVVLKKTDIEKYIGSDNKSALINICSVIAYGREKGGKSPSNSYLVINRDEPYAPAVAEIMRAHGHWDAAPEKHVETRDKKWTFNRTKYGMWNGDTFNTEEEAISKGSKEAKMEGWKEYYVGQAEYIELDESINADDIITNKADWLDDNYNLEFDPGENWEGDIVNADRALLKEMLTQAFRRWLDETGCRPTAYTIVNAKRYSVDENEVS